MQPAVHLVTGIQAAGKSTVAQALAERLPGPTAHVHGDRFRRWIVNGRVDMSPDPSPEALRQLRVRHQLTARICDGYADAGITAVAQDVVLGSELAELVAAIRTRPLHVVVLAPGPAAVRAREEARAKTAYDRWTVDALDHALRTQTPRIGLWLDTSELTVAQTVDEIVRRADESLVSPVGGASAAARVAYLSITCTRWSACRTFYEALGITFVEEEHAGVPLHLSGEVGGVVVELHRPDGPGGPVGPGFRLGFAVADVPAAVDALVAAGGVLQRSPAAGPWGLRAVVIDPDGRRVELTGPAR